MNIKDFKCYRPTRNRVMGKYVYYRKGLKQEWAKYKPWGNPSGGLLPINQRFGLNRVSFYKDLGMKGHNGIDWTAYANTCLYSPIDGTVYDIQDKDGYGKYIRIESEIMHDDDGLECKVIFIEGHLNDIIVKKGDTVKAKEFIGLTGNTGKYTTGAHLHEGARPYIKVNGKWTAKMDNGYFGYEDHYKWIVNPKIKAFKCFNNEIPYTQITDGVGGFYKVMDADLEAISSEKNIITRHIPLVDEVIHILNKQKLNQGITTEEYLQIIQE